MNEKANLHIDFLKCDFNKYLIGIIGFDLFGFIFINMCENLIDISLKEIY